MKVNPPKGVRTLAKQCLHVVTSTPFASDGGFHMFLSRRVTHMPCELLSRVGDNLLMTKPPLARNELKACYFSGTKPILDVRSEGGCVTWKEKSFLHKMPNSDRGWATCCTAWPSPTPLEAKLSLHLKNCPWVHFLINPTSVFKEKKAVNQE